ncbi:MAG: hypothetical protein NTZ35_17175, partial [Ignavibacteriales bacterium]|nr:hypothetical protein [Ignavibacteriales bacterium]
NICFHHSDVLEFLRDTETRYDYAVLTYVLHEIDETARQAILEVLSKAAREIIIVDYLAPQPRNFAGTLNELIEYVAGWGHYSNFKSFLAAEGLAGLAKQVELTIVKEERNRSSANHMLIAAGTRISPSDLCW